MRVRTTKKPAASSKQHAAGRQRLMSQMCGNRTHKKGMVICRHGMKQSALELESSSPLAYIEERCNHSEQAVGNVQGRVQAHRG